MIPISLSMQGFLSYQEPVEIDFTSFDIACITGENGAGKSSILDGITWSLFGRARKHDESIINLDSSRAEVRFEFTYEGNQYRIIRSNPRGDTKFVELHIKSNQNPDDSGSKWHPLTERTLRETDQKIIDILRLDYESFINASFLLQGEADQFTQQNPSSRKRILSQILGLEIWEIYRKSAYQKRRNIESELDLLDGRISEILVELDQEQARKDHLKQLEMDLSQALASRKEAEKKLTELKSFQTSLKEQERLVDTVQEQVEKSRERIQGIHQKISEREKDHKSYQEVLTQGDIINQEFEDWQKAQAALTDWEKTAEKFREGESKRHNPLTRITTEEARLLQEQSDLQSKYKDLSSRLKKIPELNSQLLREKENIKTLEEKLELRDEKKTELDQARFEQAEAKAENPLLFQDMQELKNRIAELEKTDGALCPLCGQELTQKERESLIKTLQADGKDLGDRYRTNQSILKKSDQIVKDLQLQITEFSLLESNLRKLIQETDRLDNQLTHLENEEQTWNDGDQKRLEAIEEILDKESYAEEARKELRKINQDLKKIGYDAEEHDRIRNIVDQGSEIQKKKGVLDSAEAALKPLNRELTDLTKQLEEEQKDLKGLESDLLQSQQTLDTAKKEAPDTKQAEKDLLQQKENENIIQRELGAAQQKVSVLQTQKQRKTELEQERRDLTQRVKQYKQLESAFGKDGVPALLIEQALPNIEAKANQILDRLSSGNMSIRFLTQREYKDSSREDMRETLDIQITDQAGYRDYEMYSGGESFRINFAIRLALSHILAQRAGARLQTLVIDEGFGSQDEVGRQRLIEAINLIKDDFEKILVITHVEQIKEAFSTQLFVEKKPHGSQVTLV
jgi:exonuclease SbcC